MEKYISIIQQFQYEHGTWLRWLSFFKQESSFMKMMLSEAVDLVADKDSLSLAEHFQNQFILKDDFINELWHDVDGQQKAIKILATLKKNDPDERVSKKQSKLRNEMLYLEKEFTMLKNEFNKYLTTL